jgi:ketosteroid isomerase-like protein
MLKRAALVFASTLLFATLTFAQQDLQGQLLAAKSAWLDAFFRGDADGVAKLETEDFVFIQQGQITDNPQQTQRNRTRGPVQQKRDTEVHRLVVNGDTAFLLGTDTITTSSDSSRQHFTVVFSRRGGNWLIQHAHYSPAEN